MSETKRLKSRNEKIQEMLTSGEQLKYFYRFTAQNSHLSLHDACQIIIDRPLASICFSFEEWNAMGRRVTKGRKGIAYYDNDGNKKFVFDSEDTHGDNRYKRLTYPIKRLLIGLDELNGTNFTDEPKGNFRKIFSGVAQYLKQNNYLSNDDHNNKLLYEGVAYLLYSKTGFPKDNVTTIHGLPYDLMDNAQLFKEIYKISAAIEEEIEEAYIRVQNQVKTIEDAEESTVSDELVSSAVQIDKASENARQTDKPSENVEQTDNFTKNIVEFQSAVNSNYKGLVALSKHQSKSISNLAQNEDEIYLGKQENYDGKGSYDNTDNSLVFITNNPQMYSFLHGSGYVISQQEMLKQGFFAEKDYENFSNLQNGILKQFECIRELKFGIDINLPESGVPFAYPEREKLESKGTKPTENLQPQPIIQTEYTISPYYQRYLSSQEKYPKAIVLIRLGDFYEAMGENAVKTSNFCDLTLTGRNVGLPERVPMCGFPAQATERYINKLMEANYSVVLCEESKEPTYILSNEEALLENRELIEDIVGETSEKEEENEQENEEIADDDEEFDDESLEQEEEKQPQEEKTKQSKPIRDRKKKDKLQPSFFDMLDPKEISEQDKFVEKHLKTGSGFAQGKFRILDKYLSNPTVLEFANFLKKEYGIGGYSSSEESQSHDNKGISLEYRDKDNPENNIFVKLKWTEVVNKIADLIDEDNYLTPKELTEYEQYLADKNGEITENIVVYDESKPLPEQTDSIDNANLNELAVDMDEKGGVKARIKSNIAAIKLVDKLFEQNRNPTREEQSILAKYVGWGGIPQVFDERNENFAKEYVELKNLLSIEDYDRAKGSVLNAHYTSSEVITGIYSALERFGVRGNNKILEPAMGTGNFFGFMPNKIAENAKLYGVELDNITGRIAQKLYPQVNVQIKGFEQTTFENDSFDAIVSNVPFGAYSVYDKEYSKHNLYIHDYFIAKGIDKLKPNGIMAVITSKGTLDKLNPTVRKHLAQRAQLLGAIRLPSTAFKKTANTEVTTDILFFQKRAEKINVDTQNAEWLATGTTAEGYEINNYYINHPEMMLGTLAMEYGLYGALNLTLEPDERNLSDALSVAIQNLPQGIYDNPEISKETDREKTQADYNIKPLCYKAESGNLYMRVGDEMVMQTLPKSPQDAYARVSAMINLRQQIRHILDMQLNGCTDETLQDEQKKLNYSYDRFVREYGFINGQTNSKLFKDDGDSALLFAAENIAEDKKSATKADIFSKRTIRPYVAVTQTENCFEALQISKNEKGKVDISYIEQLTKKDFETVISELGNCIFRNPIGAESEDKYSGYETAEEYLSGNVAKKLRTATMFAEDFSQETGVQLNPLQYPARECKKYEKNIKALEEVQPVPLTATEISVRIGASWVDKQFYKDFLSQLLDLPHYSLDGLELHYNPHDSSWRVDRSDYLKKYSQMQVSEVYGTGRANAYRLFEECLNLKTTQIYDTVEDSSGTHRVLNQSETIAAREKQNKIKESFKNWTFADPQRRDKLVKTYNNLFNQLRLPSYDGSYLKYPEMNPAIELKPHQNDAVHRIITGGNTLLHHVVGAGKTFTICAAAMKLRQYGLAKKPMIVVPNHLVGQWANEFRLLYPKANLLIASKEDLEKENRKKFVSKVALGDWDSVIIAQSSFAKIPISQERQAEKIREELHRIEDTIFAIREESNSTRGAVKNLERIKKNRESTLKKLLDADKKDNVLLFEKLGVDYLFIDEAHHYKNLFLFTKMNNVAGISSSASQRASDLQLKCEYIGEKHGGDKGVVFATGTPISNSMTEMFAMQTYLQKSTLQELGITYFDGWAADFGETTTSLEMSPSGQGYRAKTRFSKFTNLPELLTLYRSFADVKTSDMVKLNVPTAIKKIINLKPSDAVIALAEEIADRAENISHGGVDPALDNMLKITSDGKKLALDARCFNKGADDEPSSKLNECAMRIFEIWEQSQATKGAQVVFCDLSTPKKGFEGYVYGEDFDAYNDLKFKLVQMNIPKEEIAFIHEANTDLQKQALFASVNEGRVRVLIGSTEKCGAGTNIQKRLVALHHLDTPYRPSDLLQREGRIIRQGNTNKEVQIFTYVTERTFDSYSYQILENKQRFISQIDKGDLTVREAADIDETTLTYAEIKAITAANPKIKRKMELDTELARLHVLEGQYKKRLYSLQDKIRQDYPQQIRQQEIFIKRTEEDIERFGQNYNEETFSINVLGTVYSDKKEGGRALTDTLQSCRAEVVVAQYCGFKISLNPISILAEERTISLIGSGQYSVYIGASASGNLTRIDNFLTELPNRKERLIRGKQQLEQDLKVAKEEVTKPFEYSLQLEELTKEVALINAELDLNRREEVIIEDNSEEEKEIEMTEEQYAAVPKSSRKTMIKHKLMTQTMIKSYAEQSVKSPEGYIFVLNDKHYEVLGRQAEQLAQEYNLPLNTQKIDGKNTSTLAVDYDNLDKILKDLYEKGKTAKIIETVEPIAEADFIDDTDKVAEMQVELLPDFYKTQKQMHDFGYTWDGMLPLSSVKAKVLSDLGLAIYCLQRDDTERVVSTKTDFENHEGLFGVEKPDWNSFLETEKAINYFAARYMVSDSAKKVVRCELSYVDEWYTLDFIQKNYEERGKIAAFLEDKHKPNNENLKEFFPQLLEEFSLHIGGDYLEQYGWTNGDITRAIIKNLSEEFSIVLMPPDEEWKKMQPKPRHKRTFEYAKEYGELEHYRKSYHENIACKVAVEKAIEDNYDGYSLKKGFEHEIIAKYGYERIEYILANTLQIKSYDGRFSDENKGWAKGIPLIEEENTRRSFALETHPAILNGFVNIVRQLETEKSSEQHSQKGGNDTIMAVNEKASETTAKRQWLKAKVSKDALIKQYDTHSHMRMPTVNKDYADFTYNIYNNRIKDSTQSLDGNGGTEDQCYELLIADNEKIKLTNGSKEQTLSAEDFAGIISGTTAKDYAAIKREASATAETQKKGWNYVSVSERAKITDYEDRTLFKMPQGEYDGFCYYIPSRLVKANSERSTLVLSLPEDFIVKLSNKKSGEKTELTVRQFVLAVKDKNNDYAEYKIPSNKKTEIFISREPNLISVIPEEMINRPNWCIVRTRENIEKKKLDKFLIDCNNGKFAKSDDPSSWTNFETACKFARENGGEAVAYVLDGKDNICCVDLDNCIDVNGNYSPLANEILTNSKKTYCERSLSGKGLHIFGKTNGMDLRTFSKSGDLEFYQKSHIISMTGDMISGAKTLVNLDETPVKNILELKCAKRTDWKGAGSGVNGLSLMTDRDVVDLASKAKHGDSFKALYSGQDTQNNHSNSDMSLMNRLAFWCNGDKEQMLRIFATSGLYRPTKPAAYYECTAIKAVEDTTSRFQPQTQSSALKPKAKNSFSNGKA